MKPGKEHEKMEAEGVKGLIAKKFFGKKKKGKKALKKWKKEEKMEQED